MIAGTIKCSLPRPCAMAVPESSVESEGFCAQPRTEDRWWVVFRHATGDLMVRVWEHECLQGQGVDLSCKDFQETPST